MSSNNPFHELHNWSEHCLTPNTIYDNDTLHDTHFAYGSIYTT